MVCGGDLPANLVGGAGDAVGDLVGGGLAGLWGHLVADLCEGGQQAVSSRA